MMPRHPRLKLLGRAGTVIGTIWLMLDVLQTGDWFRDRAPAFAEFLGAITYPVGAIGLIVLALAGLIVLQVLDRRSLGSQGGSTQPTGNLGLVKIPAPSNRAAIRFVQFTTANRAEHHESTAGRPATLRFVFPVQRTVNSKDLPTEVRLGWRKGKLILKRFTDQGVAFEERSAGVEVRAEVYLAGGEVPTSTESRTVGPPTLSHGIRVGEPSIIQGDRPGWNASCADARDTDLHRRHGAHLFLTSTKETARNMRCLVRHGEETSSASPQGGQVARTMLHYPGDFLDAPKLTPGEHSFEWFGYVDADQRELLLAQGGFILNDKLQVFCD